MSEPVRIQLSRKKGWKLPENAVKIDRTTPWGNPFIVRPEFMTFRGKKIRLGPTAEEAVTMFAHYMITPGTTGYELAACVRRDLKGKNLACWCDLTAPCHGEVLLAIANDQPMSFWYDMDTPPGNWIKGYEREENECVATLLAGIPVDGGSASKEMWEQLIRASFQGGLVAATHRKN